MTAHGRHRCPPVRPDRHETPLAAAGFDRVEIACLTLARRILVSACVIDSLHQRDILDCAADGIGATHAAGAVFAMNRLLGAIRRSRRSVFVFNDPGCPHCAHILTKEEGRVINALASVRRRHIGAAHVQIMLLCEGNPTEVVLSALDALALLLPPPHTT